MSLQLRPDELLACLQNLNHPRFGEYVDQLLSLTDAMAMEIVDSIPNMEISHPADFWADQVMVGIKATAPMPIPPALEGFDDGGWE